MNNIIPQIIPSDISFRILIFQGKTNLLAELPKRMQGYANWLPPDYRIVILIDADHQDCHQLKQQLEQVAHEVGFVTKSTSTDGQFQVLNRIAIEELEAWFFGDIEALCKAYPRIPTTLHERRGFRNSDAIQGGTWEALERILQRAGYFPGGLLKTEAARTISTHMQPDRNRSKSFQVFRDGLRTIFNT